MLYFSFVKSAGIVLAVIDDVFITFAALK